MKKESNPSPPDIRYKPKPPPAPPVTSRQIHYLINMDDEGNGFCVNGHFNIIPACTEIRVGNKVRCPDCGALIFEVI